MSEFETLFDSLSGFYRGRAGAYDVACSALKEAIELEKESWKKR